MKRKKLRLKLKFKTRKRIIAALILAIIAALFIYVYFLSAHDYNFNHKSVSSTKLPSVFQDFKVALISDVHLQNNGDLTRLEAMVEKLNEEKCDMVLFGGDLYSKDPFEAKKVTKILKNIDTSYGKFAVLGDEDLPNEGDVTTILQDGGFEVLNDAARTIYYKDHSFVLYGMSPDATSIDYETKSFLVVLTHYPDSFTFTKGTANLQLSGHSGGGYIYLPGFGSLIKVEHAKTYNHNTYYASSSQLIISNGVSPSAEHPFKLFADNEVLIISLKNETTKKVPKVASKEKKESSSDSSKKQTSNE